MHVIDDELRGADGVKLADTNGDGRPDIVCGWEESGRVRGYLHPGAAHVRAPWPAIDVGDAESIEDALWIDLNGDGNLDVLSSCEGRKQVLLAHFSPDPKSQNQSWSTKAIRCTEGLTRWMFAVPFQRNGETEKADVVVGSKNPNGLVGILRTPTSDPSNWSIKVLAQANWVMSIFTKDVDGDGDLDVLYSDRKSSESGVYWLENPSGSSSSIWKKHLIGGKGREVMFLAISNEASEPSTNAATDAQRSFSVYAAVKPNRIVILESTIQESGSIQWSESEITISKEANIGNAKGIAVGDIQGDARDEFVFSCESAVPPKDGVVCLFQSKQGWSVRSISGPAGIKFDLIELVDIDQDGDLDVLTCEERHSGQGLGVIWYENPGN